MLESIHNETVSKSTDVLPNTYSDSINVNE